MSNTLIDKKSRKIGQWTIVKEKHIDSTPDLSWLGEFSNQWQEGAIDRFNSPRAYVENRRNEYRYFVPCNSIESHREGLIRLGYSKGNADFLARSYVMEDFETYESYGRNWGTYGFVLRILFQGIDVAWSSVWGIDEWWDNKHDNSHHDEIWCDLWYEAKNDARQNLNQVCEAWRCAA